MSISYEALEAWRRFLGHSGVRSQFVPEIVLQQETPTSVAIEVRIPLTALAYEADSIIVNRRIYRNIFIRGFRPGRAPRYLVLPYIRHWLLMESLTELLFREWSEKAASLPGQLVETSELHLDVSSGGEEEYLLVSCRCEVIPEVELQLSSSTLHQEHLDNFDLLCSTTDVMTPSSLEDLLTAALTRVIQVQLDPESLRAELQNKLHAAQVAHAVVKQYGDKDEVIDLENEVARRAEDLGMSAATFRARYLANEEQRELFTARIRQDRALHRLRSM